MNIADRMLLIHMDAVTHSVPPRKGREGWGTTAGLVLLAAAVLVVAL
jgi:hypothetical protein